MRARVDAAIGEPARQAVTLAARFLAARVMSVAGLLVASWLVGIAAFATFGIYLALINLAWLAVFLRYEQAIVAAQDESGAAAAVRLCAVIGTLVCGLVAGAAALAYTAALVPAWCAVLFPLSLAARASLRLAVMTATRNGDFKAFPRAALVQALSQAMVVVMLAEGLGGGALCLALADVAGNGVAAFFLVRRQRAALSASLRRGGSLAGLAATARFWSSLPRINLPGSLLALAFLMSPLVVMPLVADPEFAGHVTVAFRLFDVPTQIIGAAATPILLNRLRPSPGRPAFAFDRAMMGGLTAMAGAIYGGIAFALLASGSWLDGTVLAELSAVVPVIAVFQACTALSGPLAEACGLYREQRVLMPVHVLTLVGCGLALGLSLIAPEHVGLVALAVVSIVRTIMIGERLRMLSQRDRDAFMFAPMAPLDRTGDRC